MIALKSNAALLRFSTLKGLLSLTNVCDADVREKRIKLITSPKHTGPVRRPDKQIDQEILIKTAILEHSPAAIIMINKDGDIVEVSDSACTLFGCSRPDLLGADISILMPKNEGAQHASFVDTYLKTKNNHIVGTSRKLNGVHRDGSILPIRLQLEEVWDGGEPLFISFITDRRPELAARAKEQDIQAHMDAMARQSSMGELATGLAHEINQPLTAIGQYLSTLELLLGDQLEEKAADILSKARTQAQRAGDVLRSIRRFVRVQKPFRDRIGIKELIAETLQLALLEEDRQHIQIVSKGVSSAHLVYVDKVQIQQVLLNLIRNSVDAIGDNPEGLIIIEVRREEDRTALCVADNGSGVSKENEERLFEHFFSSKPRGVGVGLALCRSIVTSHNGHIWYERPNDGMGSRFCFTIPDQAAAPSMADQQ